MLYSPYWKGLVLGALVSVGLIARAQQLPEIPEIKFEKYVLENGLTLIVHEDRKAPIVAVNMWYHVGAKNEVLGKSGFAHLFEHLMFNGSEHFNDDYFQALEKIGGTDLNGTTNQDRTNYFQNVPTAALDQVLFLEADRMGFLLGAIDQAKLDEQRGVVQNEKRQGENQPYGQVDNRVIAAMYPAIHPYAYPKGTVIGSLEDLNAASLEDVQEWFKTYYGPNNATIVLAGDIDGKTALEKIKKYFGEIPPTPPVARTKAWVPTLSAPIREVMEDRVPQARVYKVWHMPEWGNADLLRMQLATAVLAQGKNSRLYKRLVYEAQLATTVAGFVQDGEVSSALYLFATVRPGADAAKVEAIMEEEFAKMVAQGPTDDELMLYKTELLANIIRGYERIGGFGGKSDVLAESFTYGADPADYKRQLGIVRNATRQEVQQAAATWMAKPNYTLVVTPYPKVAAAGEKLDRSKGLPPVGTNPPASLPKLQQATLKNGLKVVLAERHSIPVVQFQLLVNGGYAADPAGKTGLASLTANLLDEGTATRSALQISEEAARLGANLSTGANTDYMNVTANALKSNLDATMALMADIVQNPTFPEADFQRLKTQRLAAIQAEKSQPQGMALRVAPGLMFGKGHPYANPLTGSGFESTVATLTRADAAALHQSIFKANNATLVVAGDITLPELTALLEKHLGTWKGGTAPKLNVPTVKLPEKPIVYLIDRPGSIQSLLIAGHAFAPKNNPEEIAITAMNNILGADFTSRINLNLREDKHWSYGATSLLLNTRYQRPFLGFTQVQTDKTAESIAEMNKEMQQISSTERAITDAEFQARKQNMVLELAGRWETTPAVLGSAAEIVQYGLATDFYGTYAQQVQSLNLEQVRKAAQQVKPNSMIWVVVGDRAKIEAGIRALNLGEIRFIDADGNPAQ